MPRVSTKHRMIFAAPTGDFEEDDKLGGYVPAMSGSFLRAGYPIVEMTPQEWLSIASPTYSKRHPLFFPSSYRRILRGIRQGVRFAPLMLEPEGRVGPEGGHPHEGRHRAMAAMASGANVLTFLLPPGKL